MKAGQKIRIVEVGARDGLQNETAPVPTEAKIDFVDALSGTGVDEIEVSAFVSPRWVPQLGDAEEVFRRISRRQGVDYSALVPNEKGRKGDCTGERLRVRPSGRTTKPP